MDLSWFWFIGLMIYSLGLIAALRVSWVGFELVLSFMHYLLPLNAAVLIISLLIEATNPWARGGMLIFLLANLAWLARVAQWAWVRPGKKVDPYRRGNDTGGGPKALIGFMNTLDKNHRYSDIGQRIRELGLDVVGLAEMSPAGFAALKQASGLSYSHITGGGTDPSGQELAVVSRWPVTRAAVTGQAHQKLLQVQLKTPDGAWQMLVFHPYPPFTAQWLKRRNQAFDELAAITRAATTATVIVGDFNTVPWAPALLKLQRRLPHYRHAGQGSGPHHTWRCSAAGWPLKLPIDYLWLPRLWVVGPLQLDRFIGSDHRLMWVHVGPQNE